METWAERTEGGGTQTHMVMLEEVNRSCELLYQNKSVTQSALFSAESFAHIHLFTPSKE